MIQSIQKVIKIGSSAGVTIPAKDLRQENVSIGDEVEVVIRAKKQDNQKGGSDTTMVAREILEQYKTDFKNLAKR